MEKKYKILIVVSVILLIIIFAARIIFQKIDFVMVLSPDTVLVYDEDKDHFTSKLVSDLNQENSYNIRLRDGKQLKSKLTYKDIWQYEENNDIINIDSDFVAVTEDKRHSLIPFEISELDQEDLVEVNNILKEKNIFDYETLSLGQKVLIDIDNDGIKEKIVSATNVFSEFDRKEDFSLAYIEKQGKKYMLLNKNENVDDLENSCASWISGIIDLNNDKNFEVIIGCTYFDQIGTDYSIFRLSQGGLKTLK